MEIKPYWISSLVTPVAVRWLLLYAQTARARRVHGAVIFRASGLTLICGAGCAMALAIVIGGWKQDARTLTTVGGTIWFLFCLWLWPATIFMDSSGVRAKHIWRRPRLIPYSDIDFAARTVDGDTIIYGKAPASKIEITRYHAAYAELESELRTRGVNVFR